MFKEIETERLWLKNICYEDIEFIFEQFSDDDINGSVDLSKSYKRCLRHNRSPYTFKILSNARYLS